MVTNPSSLILLLSFRWLLPSAPAWTQGLTTPLFFTCLPFISPLYPPCSLSRSTHSAFRSFSSQDCTLLQCIAIYLCCHSLVNCYFLSWKYFSTLFISVWSSTLVIFCRPRRLGLKQTPIASLSPPHLSPALVPHICFRLLFWIMGIFFCFWI